MKQTQTPIFNLIACGLLFSGLFPQPLRAEPKGDRAVAQEIIQAAKPIRNHTAWMDAAGNPISCHGGGIMRDGDTFYWYGEAFKGNPQGHFGHAVPQHGLKYTDVQNGFNCYSSKNLVDWKYEGVCMSFPKDGWLATGTSHRPDVLFNDKTGKYVMWFFCIGTTEEQYPAPMLAVAVADKPTGPFTFVGQRNTAEEHGWGQDLGLFKDVDGKGYLVHDDGHRNIRVDLLAEDFQSVSGETAIAITGDLAKNKRHEGAALIRYKGKYIAAGSGVNGWKPTNTTYAVADTPLGPYKEMGFMSEQLTWNSQISNFVYLPESDKVLAMCDQWFFGPTGERVEIDKSSQLWLPVSFDPTSGVAKMQLLEEWNPWK